MENSNKSFGLILIVLAAVTLIGVFSHWTYSTWQVIDWASVIICGLIGINLFNKNK